jgi:hypothetical protein
MADRIITGAQAVTVMVITLIQLMMLMALLDFFDTR